MTNRGTAKRMKITLGEVVKPVATREGSSTELLHKERHPNDKGIRRKTKCVNYGKGKAQPPKKPLILSSNENSQRTKNLGSRRSPCRHGKLGPLGYEERDDIRTRWCSSCQANVCRLCEQTGNCHGVRARRVKPGQSYPDDPGHRLNQDSGRGLS